MVKCFHDAFSHKSFFFTFSLEASISYQPSTGKIIKQTSRPNQTSENQSIKAIKDLSSEPAEVGQSIETAEGEKLDATTLTYQPERFDINDKKYICGKGCSITLQLEFSKVHIQNHKTKLCISILVKVPL